LETRIVTTATPVKTRDQVPGWFSGTDQLLFTWFLDRQKADPPGDLLELGAYMGKSAILIGDHIRDGETFTVCDLFDSDAGDEANQAEMRQSYKTLTRTTFEENYLTFHDRLPEIVQGLTSMIRDHVADKSCRFIHVDASHLYEHVQGDIEASRSLLREVGILVCDDYRAHHTPGVAAAVWQQIVAGELRPICGTPNKLYATWGDAGPAQDELIDWLNGRRDDLWYQIQTVAGQRFVLLNWRGKKKAPPDAEIARLKGELDREKKTRRAKEQELAAVRGSISFRVGRAFTATPRRVLGRKARRDS
jgi:predicted O-methyltransferase YrrM